MPARNIIFLSYALAWCERYDARVIYTGVNAVDYSGYPDCRPEFVEAFQTMAAHGTKAGVENNPIKIHAPLIQMSKGDIIKLGIDMGVDYSLTSSCYNPDDNGHACGVCPSCRIRLKGFADAGYVDPITYQSAPEAA